MADQRCRVIHVCVFANHILIARHEVRIKHQQTQNHQLTNSYGPILVQKSQRSKKIYDIAAALRAQACIYSLLLINFPWVHLTVRICCRKVLYLENI